MWKQLPDTPVIMLCLTGLACGILYWPGLSGPLVLDDIPNLQIFFDSGRDEIPVSTVILSDSGPLGRPLSMLSFMASYYLFGAESWHWKLMDLIIHLLTGLVIYLLTLRLLNYDNIGLKDRYQWVALLATAIWLLHPLQVSTVLYLVQRMTQLSALFAFLAMLLYVYGRELQLRGGSGLYYILSSICLAVPLSVFSKENGLLAIFFLLAMELFLYKFRGATHTAKWLKTYHIMATLIIAVAAIYVLEIRPAGGLTGSYEGRQFDLYERVLTQFRVMALYMQQVIFPIPSSMPFFYDNYPLSRGVLDPLTTLFSIISVAALLTACMVFKNRYPLLCFAVFFFFAAHAMESTIIPLELVFEHRNYVALYGVALAAAVLIFKASKVHKNKSILVSILLVSMLSYNTSLRAAIWSSEQDFYYRSLIYNPGSERVRMVLSNMLANQGKYLQALGLLAEQDSPGAIIQIGYTICKMYNRLSDQHIDRMNNSLSGIVGNYEVTGIIELSMLGLDGECSFDKGKFVEFLQAASEQHINSDSNRGEILLFQSYYLWELGRQQQAFERLEAAREYIPEDPVPLYYAAEWSLDIGRRDRARLYFDEANRLARQSRFDYTYYKERLSERFDDHD